MQQIEVKTSFRSSPTEKFGNFRRFVTTNFSSLHITLQKTYNLQNQSFLVQYYDQDNDLITISSDEELQHSLQLLNSRPMKLFITTLQPGSTKATSDENLNESEVLALAKIIPEERMKKIEERVKHFRLKLLHKVAKQIQAKNGQAGSPASSAPAHKNDNSDNEEEEEAEGGKSKKVSRKFIAKLVKHVTVPDGTIMKPGASFIKTWRFRNEDQKPWGAGCKLMFIGKNSERMGGNLAIIPNCDKIGHGEEVDVSVNLVAPSQPGKYAGYWRMCDGEGRKFGQRVWVQIIVQDEGKK